MHQTPQNEKTHKRSIEKDGTSELCIMKYIVVYKKKASTHTHTHTNVRKTTTKKSEGKKKK